MLTNQINNKTELALINKDFIAMCIAKDLLTDNFMYYILPMEGNGIRYPDNNITDILELINIINQNTLLEGIEIIDIEDIMTFETKLLWGSDNLTNCFNKEMHELTNYNNRLRVKYETYRDETKRI